MQYKDFIMDYEPVTGLSFKNPFSGKVCTEGRNCRVYDSGDHKKTELLSEILLIEDFHYTKNDEKAFEIMLQKTIDLNEQGIRLFKTANLLSQKVSIFVKMLMVLLDPVPESEWRSLFIDKAELTADDLDKIGLKLPEEK